MNTCFYDTAAGRLGISENNGKITNLYFESDRIPHELHISETPLLKEAARQLDEYLAGRLREFSLPLDPAGTDFMKKTWEELCRIPYGRTATYGQLAEKIGSPKAYRAVGMANNRNPIPIFIPCHRIIGSDGSLTGYRGGLLLKKVLLDLESCGTEIPSK